MVTTLENKNQIKSDNQSLWEEYVLSEKTDLKIRNKIVLNNLKLARSEAHRSHSMSANYTIYEDLEQQATIALIWAVEKFEPNKGYQFSTFAVPVIRGRLMNFIRDKSSIIRVLRKIIDKISNYKKSENLSELDKNKYKSLCDDVARCRFSTPLENDNLIKDFDENSNTLINTKFTIPQENNQYLQKILTKKNPTPFDILNFRKVCRGTQIRSEIQL